MLRANTQSESVPMALAISKTIIVGAISAALSICFAVADEQDSVNLSGESAHQRTERIVVFPNLEAAEDAAEMYIAETGNIGIVLGYGDFKGGPGAESLGNRLVYMMQERGEQSAIFVYSSRVPGAAMAYYLPDHSDDGVIVLGSYGISEGAYRMDEVISTKRGGERLADAQNGGSDRATEWSGKPVIFEYGIGISPSEVEIAENLVEQQGCQVTSNGDGFPETVDVTVGNKSYAFHEPINAAGWAIDNCK